MRIDYQHRFCAHCETGTISGLLEHAGIEMDEPMVFGVGSGLFFAYFPLISLGVWPLLTYRITPGTIFKHLVKRLGLDLHARRYGNDRKRAMRDLDALLERGIPVGMQVGCYWLPYFPESQRIHFNTHSIIVIGKEGDDYVISDTVMLKPTLCPAEALENARFPKGMLAPNGLCYHVEPGSWKARDLKEPVRDAVLAVCKGMSAPVPIVGIKGIHYLANSIEKWPKKHDEATLQNKLGDVVVMQELVGTGGGGFRYLYAAFLKEAGERTNNPRLTEQYKPMLEIGDQWREFASAAARLRKHREKPGETIATLPTMLRDIAAREKSIYGELRRAVA
ncbi:MAG TPA: BtrH N-terminal domain-containing protein [Myxococcales bacterium]